MCLVIGILIGLIILSAMASNADGKPSEKNEGIISKEIENNKGSLSKKRSIQLKKCFEKVKHFSAIQSKL